MYTEEEKNQKFEEICQRIEQGEALRNILRYGNPPLSQTVFYDMLKQEDKNVRYARAREIYAEQMFEEIIEIADERNADVNIGDDGKMYVDGEAIQRSRLRVDTRKWMLSKLMPKKYGDKLEVDQKADVTFTWNEQKTYEANEKTD
ncbi:terminase small subunit protein [Olivibacter sp. LS-1]|uniref:terminase small subunit-like protein n=1 Tax=Olivibacter sp. LS-1 TaxID=2592345 RepID=UPI0011EB425C|nr:terminase small subunit protein [Olivibacter sp. LS-1]QEL01115.1 terminase small subunit protein [Olivibacter sp. LS-1]